MTLAEIKDQVMFQTNNDVEDVEDYLPHLVDYINDGYDRLMNVWEKNHIPGNHDKLEYDPDEPELPEWTHRALADWATWLIYRNGNPQKQQRGMQFRYAFETVLTQLSDEGGKNGIDDDGNRILYKNFRNIPR
jgi:hypothetical protein